MDHDVYFEYLRGRSFLALAYRRLYLYPRLCRHLRGHALDVGCGIGDMLAFRPDTVGVDINPRLVAWCISRGLDARPMDSDSLPFGAASFDSAIMDNVLEHIAHPDTLLREIHRVLVPGGHFVVGVPGERGFNSDPDHKVYYDEEALRRAMIGAGFESVALLYAPFRSEWLNRHMSQYCLYAVFRRSIPASS
jgi:SAM-dependent methyltransferase